ncbi:MAG TPA: trypsin-like peptidase domain-containing protein, partial [Elusimicrobiota bacterium]|nr:trypsin-like peptidase domain-containing protein [Elusimicrobiota bacterium]
VRERAVGPQAAPTASASSGWERQAALYDNAAEAAPTPEPGAAPETGAAASRPSLLWRLAGATPLLGRLLPSRLTGRAEQPPAPPLPPELRKDQYGGPPAPNLTFWEQVRYGLRSGLNLLGLGAVFHWVLRPIINAIPWPLWLTSNGLSMTGRVELMVGLGPGGADSMVHAAPARFLFLDIPRMAAMEELSYRLLNFAYVFIPLVALSYAAAWASQKLAKSEDFFLKGALQSVADFFKWLGRKAFWIALLSSAWSFAFAHLATWGIHPYTFLAHFVFGGALAWIMYRSRGLIAPFIAHSMVNLGAVLLLVAAPLWFPTGAPALQMAAGIFFLVGLGYNLLAARKDRRAVLDGLEPVSAPSGRRLAPRLLLQAAVMLALVFGPNFIPGFGPSYNPQAASAPAPSTVTLPTRIALVPPAHPALTAVEIAQRNKPAVAMVLLPQGGLGTGFIVTKEGLLVTNAHVAGPAGIGGTVGIHFDNGMTVPGTVVGVNRNLDLAFIQLPEAKPAGWPTVELGDPATLRSGDKVVAIGNPFGHEFFVSDGIVAMVHGKSNDYVANFLVHTVPVNPGNSGGPLFNDQGKVIGVNNAIYSKTGQFAGISYAIDARVLKQALDVYAKHQTISPSYLGVIVNSRDGSANGHGIPVELVRPGTPAADAGLRPGDVILSINGKSLAGPLRASVAKYHRALAYTVKGEKVTLVVRRETANSSDNLPITVTLGDENDRPDPLFDRIFGDLPLAPAHPDSEQSNSDE